ncbi:hypothetical protein AB1Y20_020392 [Prymnesium parvum]|uniref:PH domain-containing protein n=1 Tax=Prymnesium parvum TaxID=97485 RepID=A0AB34JXA1_PRYPA
MADIVMMVSKPSRAHVTPSKEGVNSEAAGREMFCCTRAPAPALLDDAAPAQKTEADRDSGWSVDEGALTTRPRLRSNSRDPRMSHPVSDRSHGQSITAIVPQQLRDAHISGWLSKRGSKFPYDWQDRLFAFDTVEKMLLYYSLKTSANGEQHFVLRGQVEVTGAYSATPSPLIGFELGEIKLLGGKPVQPQTALQEKLTKLSPSLGAWLGYTARPVGQGLLDEGMVRPDVLLARPPSVEERNRWVSLLNAAINAEVDSAPTKQHVHVPAPKYSAKFHDGSLRLSQAERAGVMVASAPASAPEEEKRKEDTVPEEAVLEDVVPTVYEAPPDDLNPRSTREDSRAGEDASSGRQNDVSMTESSNVDAPASSPQVDPTTAEDTLAGPPAAESAVSSQQAWLHKEVSEVESEHANANATPVAQTDASDTVAADPNTSRPPLPLNLTYGTALVEGWVTKRGTGFPHKWQTRYMMFEPSGNKIRYFDKPSSTDSTAVLKGEAVLVSVSLDKNEKFGLLLETTAETSGPDIKDSVSADVRDSLGTTTTVANPRPSNLFGTFSGTLGMLGGKQGGSKSIHIRLATEEEQTRWLETLSQHC